MAQQEQKKPNILVIWGDDIGISNLSCYTHGLMGYHTPNIDRIAKEGMFDGRPNDKFGIGYYFININNPTIHGPLQTRKFLRDESGLEAFYNIAITPWLLLTPDLQVLRGAQKKTTRLVQGSGGLPQLETRNIGTTTVLGVRLQMVF